MLVTRPRQRAQELCGMLEAEGAEVIVIPLLEITTPEDDRPLREAAKNVGRFAWVLFASPSAVEAFAEATRAAATLPILRNAKIAVVGPKTARAALDWKLPVARQAQTSNALGVYEAVRDLLKPGDEVLLPAAEEGRLYEAVGILDRRGLGQEDQHAVVRDQEEIQQESRVQHPRIVGLHQSHQLEHHNVQPFSHRKVVPGQPVRRTQLGIGEVPGLFQYRPYNDTG